MSKRQILKLRQRKQYLWPRSCNLPAIVDYHEKLLCINPLPSVIAIRSALRTIIVTFLVIFICPRGYCKEGFWTSTRQIPDDSKLAWDSTFLIVGPLVGGVAVGSSFLVAMTTERSSVRIFLLTNKHVIENLRPSIGPCNGVYLVHGAQLLPRTVELIPNSSQSFRVRSLTVEKLSDNPDLALLSGTLDPEEFAGFKTIEHSKELATERN